MKKALSVILALIISVSFCSCSKLEIDKTAIIESVYIYKENNSTVFQFNTVKNENTAVLEKYTVKAENIKEAKKKLEESSVSYLFLGQLECVVFSRDLEISSVFDSLAYFKEGYELSPGVYVLFATGKAIQELTEKEIPITRLNELCRLLKDEDGKASLNVYSLYNSFQSGNTDSLKVGLLFSKSQLEAHSFSFTSIKSITEQSL